MDWLEEVERDGRVCRRCGGPMDNCGPLDIVVRMPPPRATELSVRIAEHDVVERRLLDAVGWDIVDRAAVVSRLLDESGREYGDYCVVHPRRWTSTRARQVIDDQGLMYCPLCGRCLGAALGPGRLYVVRSSLGEGPLWTSDLHSLLVDEAVHQRLRSHRWRNLIFDRIPIVDQPRDGLPEHIEHYVPVAPGGETGSSTVDG